MPHQADAMGKIKGFRDADADALNGLPLPRGGRNTGQGIQKTVIEAIGVGGHLLS